MKRYLIALALLATLFLLMGCSGNHNTSDSIEARKICNFKRIYSGVDVGIGSKASSLYVDTTTGVIYLKIWGNYESGLTPLYNSDGTLKTWKGGY